MQAAKHGRREVGTAVGVINGVEQSLDALELEPITLEPSIFRTIVEVNLLISLAGVR